MSVTSDPPAEGSLLGGRYRVEGVLGRGASSTVLAATDLSTGRAVALKWLAPHLADKPGAVTRFVSEARAVGRIDHPNVVEVLDVGEAGGSPFLVMQQLRGETLRARLERGPLGVPEALEVVAAACRGVAEAHAEGVVHRDLKPDNVFVCSDGTTKVLDFGVSKLHERAGPPMTGSRAVLGTPAYMAPEQMGSSRDADVRADVYSMGAVLYECLTGRRPYEAASLYELVARIARDDAAPPSALAPRVPPDLDAIVLRAVRGDPGARQPTMRALVEDLESAAVRARRSAGEPAHAPASAVAQPRERHPGPVVPHALHDPFSPVAQPGQLPPPDARHVTPHERDPSPRHLSPPGAPHATSHARDPASTIAHARDAATPGAHATPHPPYRAPATATAAGAATRTGGTRLSAIVVVASLVALALAVLGATGAWLMRDARDSDRRAVPATRTDDEPTPDSRPTIDLRLSGACAARFDVPIVRVDATDSLVSVGCFDGERLVGSFTLDRGTSRAAVERLSGARSDGFFVAVTSDEERTYVSYKSGLWHARPDPIAGSVTLRRFEPSAAIMDVSLESVVLQHAETGDLCRVEGRVVTRGRR